MNSSSAGNAFSRRVRVVERAVDLGGRVPPNNPEAEAAVLSAILADPAALDHVTPILTPEQFYGGAHQRIYETCCELRQRGAPIDVTTVATDLRAHDRLAAIGGVAKLAKLVDATPAIVNVAAHARIVADHARIRRLIATCQMIAAAGYGDVGDAATFVTGAARDVSAIEADSLDRRTENVSDVLARWRDDGPLVRVPTGIDPLDRMCRGGLPTPWRCLIVGAPGAGKTFLELVIARHLAAAEAAVGVLAVDEEPDDIVVRLVEMAGFSLDQAERRDPADVDAMIGALAQLRLRIYDGAWTIERAAADLASWARAEKRRAVLCIDSLQVASSDAGAALERPTPRLLVEANMLALRRAATNHRMLVFATSEANRASYRSEESAAAANDLAAGAESRAIEFAAQTMLVCRTPKNHPDVVHVAVPKNRRATTGEFWLRIDRSAHSLSEIGDPGADPVLAQRATEAAQQTNRGRVERDARELIALVASSPGLSERDLRARVSAAGHRWGRERFEAATSAARLLGGLENRGSERRARWHAIAIADD